MGHQPPDDPKRGPIVGLDGAEPVVAQDVSDNLRVCGDPRACESLRYPAPLANLLAYRERMGWRMPWVSSAGTSFNRDFGVTTEDGEMFGLSAFLRDGDTIYRSEEHTSELQSQR